MNLVIDEQGTEELQAQTIAVSMKQKKFGNSKKLDEENHRKITQSIEADPERIKATEMIVNSKHPAYKEVTSLMSKVKRDFTDRTVSFPEPTIRLMHIDRVDSFNKEIEGVCEELTRRVAVLDSHRDELVQDAMDKLGSAFKPEYYPTSFRDSFSIEISYPTVGPDERLKNLNPALYEQQRQRFEAMMSQAIEETTTALATELETIFGRLAASLAEGKRLRSDMLDPLNSFLDRFTDLRIGSSQAIRDIVDHARTILGQTNDVQIARNGSARIAVAQSLAPLHDQVVNMVQARNVRRIEL